MNTPSVQTPPAQAFSPMVSGMPSQIQQGQFGQSKVTPNPNPQTQMNHGASTNSPQLQSSQGAYQGAYQGAVSTAPAMSHISQPSAQAQQPSAQAQQPTAPAQQPSAHAPQQPAQDHQPSAPAQQPSAQTPQQPAQDSDQPTGNTGSETQSTETESQKSGFFNINWQGMFSNKNHSERDAAKQQADQTPQQPAQSPEQKADQGTQPQAVESQQQAPEQFSSPIAPHHTPIQYAETTTSQIEPDSVFPDPQTGVSSMIDQTQGALDDLNTVMHEGEQQEIQSTFLDDETRKVKETAINQIHDQLTNQVIPLKEEIEDFLAENGSESLSSSPTQLSTEDHLPPGSGDSP